MGPRTKALLLLASLSSLELCHKPVDHFNRDVLEPGEVREVYVEQVEFPLLLVKQVFKNEEDGSEGVLYLVSSDLTLEYERL